MKDERNIEQTTVFEVIEEAEKGFTGRPDEWKKLLFPVNSVSVFTNDGDVEEVCGMERTTDSFWRNGDYKALVNLNSGEILSIVKQTYHAVSNIDVIEHFENLLKEEGVRFEYGFAVSARNGRKTVFELILPDLKIDLGNGDTQEMRLYVQNSFDGGNAIRLDMGFFRHACSNMALMVGNADVNYRTSHIGNATERVKTTFDMYVTKKFNEAKNFVETLSKTHFHTPDQITRLVEDEENTVVANRYRNEVLDAWSNYYGSRLDMWALYNAYTYVITHIMKGSEIGKMDKLVKLSKMFNDIIKKRNEESKKEQT